ncbi:hypothetical protein FACS1894188_10210 [Clostridia bacterium]|nr:hypothetical protein FACS1894188_10210 [Clostridia bacterium]
MQRGLTQKFYLFKPLIQTGGLGGKKLVYGTFSCCFFANFQPQKTDAVKQDAGIAVIKRYNLFVALRIAEKYGIEINDGIDFSCADKPEFKAICEPEYWREYAKITLERSDS